MSFMGDPSDEFLAIEGKDSNTKYIAAFPFHGYLPVDDLINTNGEAFLCSSWDKEYNIQLVCDNKEETTLHANRNNRKEHTNSLC